MPPKTVQAAPLKAMLAVPTRGDIWHETMLMIAGMSPCVYRDGLSVASNRNKIARDFLQGKHNGKFIGKRDVLFMIDDDVLPMRDDWAQIMSAAPFDICAAPVLMHKLPDVPIIWNCFNGDRLQTFDLPEDGYVECDAVGTGLIMIHRRVLEHPDMRAPFLQELDPDGVIHVGQDIQFCRRAKKAGFTVGVAAAATCDHIKRMHLSPIPWVYGDATGVVKNKIEE